MVALEPDKFWRQGRLFVDSGGLSLKDNDSSAGPPQVFKVSDWNKVILKQDQLRMGSISN